MAQTDWTQGMPYDGWFNGHVPEMIRNGTYLDFRPKIVERVNFGFYDKGNPGRGEQLLKEWDDLWENIPLAVRKAGRKAVTVYSTPKDVQLVTSKGVVTVKQAGPSGDMQLQDKIHKDRPTMRKKAQRKTAKGRLTDEDNPLDKLSSSKEKE